MELINNLMIYEVYVLNEVMPWCLSQYICDGNGYMHDCELVIFCLYT